MSEEERQRPLRGPDILFRIALPKKLAVNGEPESQDDEHKDRSQHRKLPRPETTRRPQCSRYPNRCSRGDVMYTVACGRAQDHTSPQKSNSADDPLNNPACGGLIEASLSELSREHDEESAPDRYQGVEAHTGRLSIKIAIDSNHCSDCDSGKQPRERFNQVAHARQYSAATKRRLETERLFFVIEAPGGLVAFDAYLLDQTAGQEPWRWFSWPRRL
jgi:hypothetical protein